MQIFFGLSVKLVMNALLVAGGVGDWPPELLLGDRPAAAFRCGGETDHLCSMLNLFDCLIDRTALHVIIFCMKYMWLRLSCPSIHARGRRIVGRLLSSMTKQGAMRCRLALVSV